VRIVRAGRQWTVHWAAFRHYYGKLAENFDVVVDEVNTIPFFTPIWADVPVVMLIHQLAREVWWYESAFPLSAIGFLAEPQYLRFYRHVPVLTISASTRDDLRRLGFNGSITIIPEGLEPITDVSASKPSEPTFLYVGRLAPSKRIGHIFQALARFRQVTGAGTLWLIGSGSPQYQQSLTKLAKRLHIANYVTFCGRVSSSEKHRLMAGVHALLMTSVREGWGLVVTEANACGTPAIVYDVPGLRDSVRNESTGLVVAPRPDSLSEAMIRLTSDTALHARLAAEGRSWSATFSFDEAARAVWLALDRLLAA
jgi:glycosyltransferase involved in cell wall biosynthesis